MSLFAELKRRNVFRVGTAYVVVGWLLTEILATLLPMFGVPDWVGKAVVIILAVAFIPVLLFAWAFEMTPEGIKREAEVDRSTSITGETGKKLNYVTIAAVILGVAFLAYNRSVPHTTVAPEEVVVTVGAPSVAVLPFVNMSGNAENEYFSDGLTETLLHMLAQIPELRVAARTSSFAFKGQDSDIREIASALDVAHILEGSVQRSGDRVRITAQLIRAKDGFHVWSENFDRTLDDVFAIQDEIADRVGSALSASLLGDDGASRILGVGTENLEAYDLYLQSLAEHAKGSYGALQKAEGLLKQALVLDPGFHDAKTELALGYMLQRWTGLLEGKTPTQSAIALLEQVLAVQPDDVRAQTILFRAEFDLAMSGANISAAQDVLELLDVHARSHPNDFDAAAAMASALSNFNRREEALKYRETMVSLDPLNSRAHLELGRTYMALEQIDEARTALQYSIELETVNPTAWTSLADIEWERGNAVGFIGNFLKAIEVDPDDHELPGSIAQFLYQLALPVEAEKFHSQVIAMAPSSPVAYGLDVMQAASIGDQEQVRAAAKRAILDDIDNRQGAYSIAVDELVTDAVDNGNLEETVAWLEAHVPGLADMSTATDSKHVGVRFSLFPALIALLPEEEARRYFDELIQYLAAIGIDHREDPMGLVMENLVLGNDEEVIRVLHEELLTEPVITLWYLEDMFEHFSVFRKIAGDSRIQADLKRMREEKSQVQADVSAFLADHGT